MCSHRDTLETLRYILHFVKFSVGIALLVQGKSIFNVHRAWLFNQKAFIFIISGVI